MVVNNAESMPYIPNATITYIHIPPMHTERSHLIPQKILLKYFRMASKFILTNSNYTKPFVERFTKRKALVLHPPVDVEKYAPHANFQDRSNIVAIVGRISPEKNYEIVADLAKRMPDVKFVIFGSLTKNALTYYWKIKELITKLNLKNVVLKVNASLEEKVLNLSRAKVYLHAAKNEHFGISVVEAMAAGCVPVVHKSGGPWIDILEREQGLHGFAYENVEEAVNYVREVLTNESLRLRIVRNNIGYVQKFSSRVFEEKLQRIIETITR